MKKIVPIVSAATSIGAWGVHATRSRLEANGKPARLQQIRMKKKRHLVDRDDIASKPNQDLVRFDLALEAQLFCSLNTLGRYMQCNGSIP